MARRPAPRRSRPRSKRNNAPDVTIQQRVWVRSPFASFGMEGGPKWQPRTVRNGREWVSPATSMRGAREWIGEEFSAHGNAAQLYRVEAAGERPECFAGIPGQGVVRFTAPHWGTYVAGGNACSGGLDWFGAWQSCRDGYVMAHVAAAIVPRKLWTLALLALARPVWTGPLVASAGYHEHRIPTTSPEGKIRAATQEALDAAHAWASDRGGSVAAVREASRNLESLLDAWDRDPRNAARTFSSHFEKTTAAEGVAAVKSAVRSVFETRDAGTQRYDTTPLSFIEREWRVASNRSEADRRFAWANVLRGTIAVDQIAEGLVKHGMYT